MRNCVAVLLVVALCGCERSEAEVRREQAQAGLNALVGAIMSQDPTRLKSVLSRDQIEIVQRRADGAGETFDATLLLEYAPQKRGLILNFGEEWLAKNVIEVSEVRDRGDALFEISTSFNGDPKYGKPVYFSLEGDDFKFAGITPKMNPAVYSAAAAYFWWNHWKFNNFVSGLNYPEHADFWCADASYASPPGFVSFITRLYRGEGINPASCFVYEYWYGAKKTGVLVEFLTSYPGEARDTFHGDWWASECMYNAIGADAMVTSAGNFACTPP